MTDTRVLVLVGSLRADSVNRRLAEALQASPPEGVSLQIAEGIGAIPFYNEEIDGDTPPAAAVRLREQVAAADRVLVITPEYNGTMPAVVNNAIDWLSRPYGAGAIVGKPFAAIGTTPTPYGGTWSHEHARHSATIAGADVIDSLVLSQPGVEVDVLNDEAVLATFRTAVAELAAWRDDAAA